MNILNWRVYLAGEIHSNWRQEIADGMGREKLPVDLVGPVTDHGVSDNCGIDILGAEEKPFWVDHKGGKINAIRTRTLIEKSDIVVVCFGEKYRQWNAAFDAGYAAACGKRLITLHSTDLTHPLKEVDSAAFAVAATPDQVVRILKYVTQ